MYARCNNDISPLTSIVVEKERKQAEKKAKFEAKKSTKAAAPGSASTSNTKAKKPKADASAEPTPHDYVEETPDGQKKSMWYQLWAFEWASLTVALSTKTTGR